MIRIAELNWTVARGEHEAQALFAGTAIDEHDEPHFKDLRPEPWACFARTRTRRTTVRTR